MTETSEAFGLTGKPVGEENGIVSSEDSVIRGLAQAFGDILQRESASDATTQAFFAKIVSFIVAEVTSELFYLFMRELAADTDISAAKVLSRLIYAVFNTFLFTFASWYLTGKCAGTSFFRDFVKLFRQSCMVMVAWSWKDVTVVIEQEGGLSFWSELIIACAITLLLALAQVTSCYHRATDAVAAGGTNDTLVARFLSLPASLGLTLGYAWNLVVRHVISVAQGETENRHIQFFIQANYSLFISYVVQFVTTKIGQRLSAKESTTSKSAQREKALLTMVSTTSSFLQAWALLDVLDEFFFKICWQCGTPSTCNYQSNLVFSAAITVVFSHIVHVINLTPQSDKDAQRVNALTLNSMMLTAGWAWKNTILSWERYFQEDAGDLKYPPYVNYIIVLCGAWVVCAIVYHWLLTVGRAKERSRADTRDSISAGFNFQHHEHIGSRLKTLESMVQQLQSQEHHELLDSRLKTLENIVQQLQIQTLELGRSQFEI